MPLRLFKLRNVATANVIGMLWAAAMFAWFFISALYLQRVLGYNAMQVGLAFLPANLIMAAFSLGLSAKMVMRFGIRLPLATGLLLAATGLALFARAPVKRDVCAGCAARDAAARPRCRHCVQSAAARGDERRRAERFRPCVGRRQYVVHDGRRTSGSRCSRALPTHQRSTALRSGLAPAAAQAAGYHVAFAVGAAFALAASILGATLIRTGVKARERRRGTALERS